MEKNNIDTGINVIITILLTLAIIGAVHTIYHHMDINIKDLIEKIEKK